MLNFSAAAAFAETPDWENRHILHINTEPLRSTFVPFANVDQALKNDSTNSPFYLSPDAKMCWLVNSSCGPGVLEKFSVPPTNYSMTLRLAAVRNYKRNSDAADEASKLSCW